MSYHPYLAAVLNRLHILHKTTKNKRVQTYLQGAIDDQLRGIEDANEQIYHAKNVGVRNPEFDGDMIGRPDDDF